MRLIGAFVSKMHMKGETLDATLDSLRLQIRLSLKWASLLRSRNDSRDELFSEPRLSKL